MTLNNRSLAFLFLSGTPTYILVILALYNSVIPRFNEDIETFVILTLLFSQYVITPLFLIGFLGTLRIEVAHLNKLKFITIVLYLGSFGLWISGALNVFDVLLGNILNYIVPILIILVLTYLSLSRKTSQNLNKSSTESIPGEK